MNHLYQIINNHYNFSLRDTKKTTFFKVKLTNNPVKLSLVLSSELKALKGFIDKHQLPISASFQRLINTSEISGKLDTLITYQTNIFNVDNKITAIKASFTRAGHNERFKFFGDLHFQSQLNLITNSKADLVITFTGKNAISIQPSQAQFFSMLSQAELSPEIISILQDNPLTYLTATIADNSTLSLNNNKISLSDIEISADNNKRTHQVKLANITYSQNGTNTNFNNKSANATPYALTVENFILDSQLHVKALSPITHEPVILYLTGSINNSNNHTLLNFTERSFVTLNHIVMHKTNKPKTPAHHAKKANSRKKILSLKQFTAALSGNVQLLADSSLSVDLKVKSQAAQLNIPKTLQLSTIALLSQIKGKLENIQFHSSVHADQINLGNITITGALLSPKIEVAANNLPLTDLLSLKMQLL